MPRKVDRFNVDGEDYVIEPIMDSVPTQGSENGVESGGVYTELEALKEDIHDIVVDKSSVPEKDSTKAFTAGGAYNLQCEKFLGVIWKSSGTEITGYCTFGENTIVVTGLNPGYTGKPVAQYSEDGGDTWENSYVEDPPQTSGALPDYECVVEHGEDGNMVLGHCAGAYIYYSDDDGKNFYKATIPSDVANVPVRNFCWFKGVWVCAGGDTSICLYSTDKGHSWQHISNAFTCDRNHYFEKSNNALVCSTAPTAVPLNLMKRTVDGINWTDISIPVNNQDVVLYMYPSYSNGTWVMGTDEGIYRSTDDVASWQLISSLYKKSRRPVFFKGLWLMLRDVSSSSTPSYALEVSFDDGSSWRQVDIDGGVNGDLYKLGEALFTNIHLAYDMSSGTNELTLTHSLNGFSWEPTAASGGGTGGNKVAPFMVRYKAGKYIMSTSGMQLLISDVGMFE